MFGANAEEVTVAGHDHHVQLGVAHLHAHSDRQGAAVDAVEPEGLRPLLQVYEVSRAADARDDYGAVDRLAQPLRA